VSAKQTQQDGLLKGNLTITKTIIIRRRTTARPYTDLTMGLGLKLQSCNENSPLFSTHSLKNLLSYTETTGVFSVFKTTGIPRFMSLIHSSKTARKAKIHKTKINFPLLPKKRCQQQRSVCKRKELV
jgi:hypothetical protein